ncbi:MAG: alpha/beta hydrolase [Deltaproteobacteria bacterium]|jgi:pimeloyl-ACP methyl ester carboxylesterase|nr:alpha/beta hydrolase [Deltaproteobacteria bacterium]
MDMDEASLFADYEEVSLRSGGALMTLSIWKAAKSAPSLVFYPGTMASPLLYSDLLHRLREYGFNTLGIHHISHGKSPKTKKTFTFQDLLQNGKDAVSYALERFTGRVALAGHSQGGILCLAQAGQDERLSVAFPFCFLLPDQPEAVEITRWKRFAPQRERLLRFLARAAACMPRFPVVIPMYLDLGRVFAGSYGFSLARGLRGTRLSYPLAYVVSLFSADLAYLAQPGNIRCPVLGMVAGDDALFTPQLMRETLRRIFAPYKELIVMPGGGHMAPLAPQGAAEYAAVVHERCVALGLFSRSCA